LLEKNPTVAILLGFVQHFKTPGYEFSKEVAYVSEINDDRTILTNVGFPNQYESNQVYKWMITYPGNHYIKLIFSYIELNVPKVSLFFII
jgi:hypothetical protein